MNNEAHHPLLLAAFVLLFSVMASRPYRPLTVPVVQYYINLEQLYISMQSSSDPNFQPVFLFMSRIPFVLFVVSLAPLALWMTEKWKIS